jgi:hypothetical protein
MKDVLRRTLGNEPAIQPPAANRTPLSEFTTTELLEEVTLNLERVNLTNEHRQLINILRAH